MKKFSLLLITFVLSFQLSAFDEFLVGDIRIIGLQRVSTGSIFNVIPISVGDKINLRKSNDIVKSLFATEQFDDIQIGKDGNTLIISVKERPSTSLLYVCASHNSRSVSSSVAGAVGLSQPVAPPWGHKNDVNRPVAVSL